MCGLKQASLEFRNSVDELLRATGYTSTADPYIYVKDVSKNDSLAISTNKTLLNEFGAVCRTSLPVHSGDILQYMGMAIQVSKTIDVC